MDRVFRTAARTDFTDIDATVYSGSGCTGDAVGTVKAQGNYIGTGKSLYIR
ncbi:hypothetical protein OG735_00295 [Streptomyces sp. NBC_01210]|uniref:hypothetical protein n=1 Tax=Streptomyces sp. NBC_01210 TaxID=2903774 RepID=UPI002E15AF3A|nr:hypothetical protein OG735_00295 [Streptomyces sp. NBC_01210]